MIDPGHEPLAYALAALKRAPFLLIGQWTPLPADAVWMFAEQAQEWLLVRASAFLALLAVVLFPLIRRDRVSLFWLTGMLLALLPICATVPMNRNLLFVAIGGFGLTAHFIAGALGGASWLPKSRLYRVPIWMVCVVLLLAHIPVALAGRIWSQKMFFSLSRNAIYSTEAGRRIMLPDLSVEILSVDRDGFPDSVRFDFPRPLEDPAYLWLRWNWKSRGLGSYSDFSVPALGEVIIMPEPR